MTDVITDRPANDRKDFLFDAVTIPQSQKELGCHKGRLILVSAPHPRKQPTQAKLSDPIEIQHDTIFTLGKDREIHGWATLQHPWSAAVHGNVTRWPGALLRLPCLVPIACCARKYRGSLRPSEAVITHRDVDNQPPTT